MQLNKASACLSHTHTHTLMTDTKTLKRRSVHTNKERKETLGGKLTCKQTAIVKSMWTDRQEVMAVTSNFRGHSDAIGLCHDAFKHTRTNMHIKARQ